MAQHLRDFTTISPSAKSVLLMKGYTTIPYAKQVADLLQGPEVFGIDFSDRDFWFWIRVMHFEARYRSIDQLLHRAGCTNVLELSSGYSLRGLHLCATNPHIHYIDTDLPEVMAAKQQVMDALQVGGDAQGRYELLPLNALDEQAFNEAVGRFDDGPLAIVNEGLLMYLNEAEKIQLCRHIYSALKKRGGYWITADVYVKRFGQMPAAMPQTPQEAEFLQQHHIDDNKFDDYTAARKFFEQQGFEFVEEAVVDFKELSVIPHLLEVMPPEVRDSKDPPPKIQATWMLKAVSH